MLGRKIPSKNRKHITEITGVISGHQAKTSQFSGEPVIPSAATNLLGLSGLTEERGYNVSSLAVDPAASNP